MFLRSQRAYVFKGHTAGWLELPSDLGRELNEELCVIIDTMRDPRLFMPVHAQWRARRIRRSAQTGSKYPFDNRQIFVRHWGGTVWRPPYLRWVLEPKHFTSDGIRIMRFSE